MKISTVSILLSILSLDELSAQHEHACPCDKNLQDILKRKYEHRVAACLQVTTKHKTQRLFLSQLRAVVRTLHYPQKKKRRQPVLLHLSSEYPGACFLNHYWSIHKQNSSVHTDIQRFRSSTDESALQAPSNCIVEWQLVAADSEKRC